MHVTYLEVVLVLLGTALYFIGRRRNKKTVNEESIPPLPHRHPATGDWPVRPSRYTNEPGPK